MDPTLLWFGGFLVFLAAIAVVFLRKPLLAVTPALPGAVLRDLAFRFRMSGYAVSETERYVRFEVGSLAALKIHARSRPRGTEVRYEVDATPKGWTVVIIGAAFGYGIVGLVLAAVIHGTARGFARQRVRPLLGAGPLGQPPPRDARSLLLEGLSEAHRLVSEAARYERESGQNRIGLLVIGSFILWGLLFGGLAYLDLFVSLELATATALPLAVVGSFLVYRSYRPVVAGLDRERDMFAAALASEVAGATRPEGQRGGLEFLLLAANRSAAWREIRRKRKLWNDPLAGFTIFLLGYWAVMLLLVAASMDFLPIESRAALAALGIALGAACAWTAARWRREVRKEDERDRQDWDRRRAQVEGALWKILAG